MIDDQIRAIRQSYDQIADEYARRIYHELQGKPFDRELLSRFAGEVSGRGEVCDMGCGPGHVARYLQSVGASVFGLDISSAMVEQARRLNPGIRFQVGDMLALDRANGTLAGIVSFYAIVNIPKQSLPTIFREMFRCCKLAVCFCLHFTSETRPRTTTSCGIARFPWTSSIFNQPRFGATWRRRDSQSGKSSSASRMRRKWNTRVEGRTFGRGSPYRFATLKVCWRPELAGLDALPVAKTSSAGQSGDPRPPFR